jgi:hypothetical protein
MHCCARSSESKQVRGGWVGSGGGQLAGRRECRGLGRQGCRMAMYLPPAVLLRPSRLSDLSRAYARFFLVACAVGFVWLSRH